MEVDPRLVIPDKELSLAQGAIKPYQWQSWYFYQIADLAHRYGFSLDTPVKNLKEEDLNLLLYGEGGRHYRYRNRYGRVREHTEGFEGVIPYLERLYRDTESELTREK